MSENINYEMSTKYKPEFKKFLTYQKLYETIDTESKYDLFDSREIFTSFCTVFFAERCGHQELPIRLEPLEKAGK